MPYAELHALSNFSFQRGASHAGELIGRAAALGYSAIAITDECSFAGIVRAYQAVQQAENIGRIRLIVGAEFKCADGLKLVMLAPTRQAYQQISALISRARRTVRKGGYRLTREDAAELCRNALVLWIPGPECSPADARWVRAHFRDAWIAVELHLQSGDQAKLASLLALGTATGLPCVAAGDVHYHIPQRRPLQDVMTALRLKRPISQCGQQLFANAERHLREPDQLANLYPAELLAESVAIAGRCTFSMAEIRYDYPRELVPEGLTPTQHLRNLTEDGIRRRWPEGAPDKVLEQIGKELELIAELKYEAFFLTVHDIVAFANEKGILCQGRGSAANSAVCYALGVTSVDPAQQNLLFGRFLSRERAEPPDIDVDFEHERREEIIQHIYGKYGRARAAIAATVICYRSRSALRDVGRALGVPPEDIDRLARSLAWWDDPDKLDDRLQALGFDLRERQLRLWMQLARELTGFPRHLSQHVGGFVISDRPLSELVPVEKAAMPDRTIIQWDKDDLEALGLLKVDVLALGMLTAIRKSFELIKQFRPGSPRLTLATIPQDDDDTYAMIQRGETVGVFQIESRAQMNMLVRLKPKNFYDLAVQVAIVRPGPIQGDMVHPYLKNRLRDGEVHYPKGLEEVLARTFGVPIFQEQVMQIAVIAAGFTAGEADQMRRSMAAWKRSGGLEKFRERLLSGMARRKYEPEFAQRIYQQILGFGSYGFPESHAISFALLAYASSWLKCEKPAAFIAGLLNSQPMGFYPPSMLVREALRLGVEVLPVDVTVSGWECTLEPSSANSAKPAIRLGLHMISALNQATAARIIEARSQMPFTGVGDLVARARLDARARRVLADADALAALAEHRNAARWAAAGAEIPLELLREAGRSEIPLPLPAPSEGREIVDDYRTTRLTLRRHPLALLRGRLRREGVVTSAELRTLADRTLVKVAGLVMFRQRPATASGLMFMTLEDETGVVNLVVPAKLIDQERDVLIGTSFIFAEGQLQNAEGTVHVFLRRAEDRSRWIGELPYLSRDFQ